MLFLFSVGVLAELDKLEQTDEASFAEDDDVEEVDDEVEDEWSFSLVSMWFFKMLSGEGDEGNDVSKFVCSADSASTVSRSTFKGFVLAFSLNIFAVWRVLVDCCTFNGSDEFLKI